MIKLSEVKVDPIPWLLENAGPIIRYRTLTELQNKPLDDPEVVATREAILETAYAKEIMENIKEDGCWFDRLHEGLSGIHNAASTEVMFPRMLEVGFLPEDDIVQQAAKYQWHLLENGLEADTKEFDDHQDHLTYAYKYITFLPAAYLSRIGSDADPRIKTIFENLRAGIQQFFKNDLQHNLWERKKNVLRIREEDLWLHDAFILPDLYYLELFAYHPTFKKDAKWRDVFRETMSWWLEGGRPQGLGSFVWDRTNIVHGNNVNFHTLEVAQSYDMSRHYLIKLEQAVRMGIAHEFNYFQTEILKLAALQHPDGYWELNGMDNSPQRLEYAYIPLEENWENMGREVDITFRVTLILTYFEKYLRI